MEDYFHSLSYCPGPGFFVCKKIDTALISYLLKPKEQPFFGLFSKSEGFSYWSGEGYDYLGQMSTFLPNPIDVALWLSWEGRLYIKSLQ